MSFLVSNEIENGTPAKKDLYIKKENYKIRSIRSKVMRRHL